MITKAEYKKKRGRPALPYAGVFCGITLPEKTADEIRAFCRARNTALSLVAALAIEAYLSRLQTNEN